MKNIHDSRPQNHCCNLSRQLTVLSENDLKPDLPGENELEGTDNNQKYELLIGSGQICFSDFRTKTLLSYAKTVRNYQRIDFYNLVHVDLIRELRFTLGCLRLLTVKRRDSQYITLGCVGVSGCLADLMKES